MAKRHYSTVFPSKTRTDLIVTKVRKLDDTVEVHDSKLNEVEARLIALEDDTIEGNVTITGNLTAQGDTTMEGKAEIKTGPLLLPDGLETAPSLSFSNDTNLGLYRSGTDQLTITAGGNSSIDIGDTKTTFNTRLLAQSGGNQSVGLGFGDDNTGWNGSGNTLEMYNNGGLTCSYDNTGIYPQRQIRTIVGSAAAPSYTFTGDTDTGVFQAGANLLGLAGGGVQSLTVGAGAITAANPHRAADGAASAPSYSFTNATGAGLYHVGGGDICLTSQATDRLLISSTVDVKTPLTVSGGVTTLPDGSATNPTLVGSTDNKTGIYFDTGKVLISASGDNICSFDSAYGLAISDNYTLLASSIGYGYASYNGAGPHTVDETSSFTQITSSGTYVVNLPQLSADFFNRILIVKVSKAATGTKTLTPFAGDTIDGFASVTLVGGECITLFARFQDNEWLILSKY